MFVGQKVDNFEIQSHNSHTHDPPQLRGCSWGDYATQGADQGLKWEIMASALFCFFVDPELKYQDKDRTNPSPRYLDLKKAQA